MAWLTVVHVSLQIATKKEFFYEFFTSSVVSTFHRIGHRIPSSSQFHWYLSTIVEWFEVDTLLQIIFSGYEPRQSLCANLQTVRKIR